MERCYQCCFDIAAFTKMCWLNSYSYNFLKQSLNSKIQNKPRVITFLKTYLFGLTRAQHGYPLISATLKSGPLTTSTKQGSRLYSNLFHQQTTKRLSGSFKTQFRRKDGPAAAAWPGAFRGGISLRNGTSHHSPAPASRQHRAPERKW